MAPNSPYQEALNACQTLKQGFIGFRFKLFRIPCPACEKWAIDMYDGEYIRQYEKCRMCRTGTGYSYAPEERASSTFLALDETAAREWLRTAERLLIAFDWDMCERCEVCQKWIYDGTIRKAPGLCRVCAR